MLQKYIFFCSLQLFFIFVFKYKVYAKSVYATKALRHYKSI